MDTALQRRSKLRSTNTTQDKESDQQISEKKVLGDSDKISLQIYLDVLAYGEELRKLGLDPTSFEAYVGLQNEVAETKALLK